jgi:hypothetical protein
VIGRVGAAVTLLSRTREVFSSGRAPIILTKDLCIFSVSLGKLPDTASINPQVLPSKSFPIHVLSYHSIPRSLASDNIVKLPIKMTLQAGVLLGRSTKR